MDHQRHLLDIVRIQTFCYCQQMADVMLNVNGVFTTITNISLGLFTFLKLKINDNLLKEIYFKIQAWKLGVRESSLRLQL